MNASDLFNAVVGYYLIVLAVSAASGVRQSLRDPAGAALAPTTSISTESPSAGSAPSLASRAAGAASGRTVQAAHRFGWATGVGAALGWLAGVEMYRAGRRGAIIAARRTQDWREKRRTARDGGPADADGDDDPSGDAPQAGDDWLDDHRPPAPDPGEPAPPAPADSGPEPAEPDAAADPDDAELIDDEMTWPLIADPAAAAAGRRPGRPPLYLVPPPQEYPPIMPAAEIYDLESLINFTDQTAQVAGMEAEDAAAAAASMIAGAEFAGETATRVADETVALEGAVAAMAMLRVDAESTAAYHALLEAGAMYRDTTSTFSAQCHDAAHTAGQMSAAAAHYNDTAAHALAVLNAHQMPHAEAANATGHSGAHGAFYGVADTGGQAALAGSGAPQLPAS